MCVPNNIIVKALTIEPIVNLRYRFFVSPHKLKNWKSNKFKYLLLQINKFPISFSFIYLRRIKYFQGGAVVGRGAVAQIAFYVNLNSKTVKVWIFMKVLFESLVETNKISEINIPEILSSEKQNITA